MHGLRFAWASLVWFLAKLPPIARLVWRIIAVPLGWAGWLIVWFWNTAPMQSVVRPVARLEARIGRWLNRVLPKGLYTRALLIIIMPMVLLQTVVAYVFMERHWQAVTARLSQALSQDIAALIDVYDQFPARNRRASSPPSPSSGWASMWISCRRTFAAAPAEAVLRHSRSIADRRTGHAHQAPVLDRHGGALEPRGDPHPARPERDAHHRAAQPGLCLELAYLPGLDGGLVAGADRVSVILLRNQIRPSCGSRKRRRISARGVMSSSGRVARRRCGRRASPSWR